jgi:CheY-like chemotaxis protein
VIDDELMFVKAMRRMLEHDHDVIGVTSAEAALDLIRQGTRFDVILCDLMMPQVTGIDFYQRLASYASGEERKVVFLTGGAHVSDTHDFLADSRHPCLDKPVDVAQLRALINTLLPK